MAYVNNNNNKNGQRINEMIRVREVRLIDDEGNQLGIVATQEALKMAKDRDLDLVEVSPNANPPVCKILDYGKYKFEQEKKLRDSKKNQKVLKLKEGDKVKVTIRFRGRELAHTELGYDVLNEVLKRLTSAYNIDKPAAMDGRNMSMTISAKAAK